jgi:hypothetical protein
MQPFAENYKHDKRFARTDWLCRCQQAKEDEAHLISGQCNVYGEVREKYGDLITDESLVSFFSEVLSLRDKLEDEEKEQNKLKS